MNLLLNCSKKLKTSIKMLIQKYTPLWVQHFQELKLEFQNALYSLNFKIEHVGSTSVVGLAAKPIIDIDIIYYNELDFQKIKEKLINIGYFHNGDQGIPGREVFKRKNNLEKHSIMDKHMHHLYVCINDSEELKRHLIFRDFLRENDLAKEEYQKLKIDIAKETKQDRKKYAALKEILAKEFIQSTIDKSKNII